MEFEVLLTDRSVIVRELVRSQQELVYAHLENGLCLGELSPRMLTSEHLHHQTAHTPDVGCGRVHFLLHHFRCHPEYRTLEGRSIRAFSSQQIYVEFSKMNYKYGSLNRTHYH